MDNKRRHKRFERHYEIEFSSNGHIHKGISADFSLNGLFIKTDNPLAPNSIIDVVVHITDGMTLKLKGRVRRALKTSIGQRGMGVEITERDINYSRFITSYYVQHTKSILTRY